MPDTATDPEVLAINIIEMEEASGDFANGIEFARKHLCIQVNAEDYRGIKVLAVPRCCQKKNGTQDRDRINSDVQRRALKTQKGFSKGG